LFANAFIFLATETVAFANFSASFLFYFFFVLEAHLIAVLSIGTKMMQCHLREENKSRKLDDN
jgi:hypothetical protein